MNPKDSSAKDVIYIDVDDEITAIIDKVQSSASKIVALVLPKRAGVLQSIVNMKLLQRSAETARKRLVLITSDPGIMPLAGIVGLYIASTPQSKPVIPAAPVAASEPVAVDANNIATVSDADGSAVPAAISSAVDADAPIEIDNDDKAVAGAAAATAVPSMPLDKKLKVPSFNRFRTRLFLAGGLLVLLIIGWFVAFNILPKATITVRTDSVNVESQLELIASPDADEIDIEEKIVRASSQELKKTNVQKVPATGKEDRGTKATGSVTFTNCTNTDGDITIPAGTGISNGSITFITQSAVSLDEARFNGSAECRPGSDQTGQTRVVAQNNGDQSNLSARAYTIAGGAEGLRAQGSDMTGGTSNIVTVVSQADVDGARQKAATDAMQAAKTELTGQITADSLVPIAETFAAADPTTTTAPGIGMEATEVTVTTVSSYTMLGVNKDDLRQFVETDVKAQINTETQTVLDNGIDKAVFRSIEKQRNGNTEFIIEALASAGVKQDEAEIREAIKGKKKGDVESELNSRPGVREVSIKYSPFWVSRTPSDPEKIIINFEQISTNE